ncbi:MAG TPA: aldose epimerase family protein, partial [Chitinophagaceae bacterium]|nr:aldose epimerase family protein [Chitinophagaceae bacterium]
MPEIEQQYGFTEPGQGNVWLFTLKNSRGTEVVISNYGAIITSFKVPMADGTLNDIVLGFDKMPDYRQEAYLKNYPWFGAAVGRYANRIKDASFAIDGKRYWLSKNSGNNILHGGHAGFDRKLWQVVASGSEPVAFLQLRYRSADGEEGFPGNLTADIRFELNDDNELSYRYTAVTDAPTAVNLTHHSYFNLHNGKGDIRDHLLKINAGSVLEQGEDLTCNGNVLSVKETPFDFTHFRRIGDGLNEVAEYDKSYIKDTMEGPAAELKSGDEKITLQVFTTDPVIHFYSGKWIPAVTGKNNTTYEAFSGLCLETQIHPNAINIPEFPNTILRPG